MVTLTLPMLLVNLNTYIVITMSSLMSEENITQAQHKTSRRHTG